jgi:hypothetical protein
MNLCQFEIFWGKKKEEFWMLKRVRQRQETRFTSLGLAMDNLNIDCSMSSATTKSTASTHPSELSTFFGWQYASLITHRCLAKLASAFGCN